MAQKYACLILIMYRAAWALLRTMILSHVNERPFELVHLPYPYEFVFIFIGLASRSSAWTWLVLLDRLIPVSLTLVLWCCSRQDERGNLIGSFLKTKELPRILTMAIHRPEDDDGEPDRQAHSIGCWNISGKRAFLVLRCDAVVRMIVTKEVSLRVLNGQGLSIIWWAVYAGKGYLGAKLFLKVVAQVNWLMACTCYNANGVVCRERECAEAGVCRIIITRNIIFTGKNWSSHVSLHMDAITICINSKRILYITCSGRWL